MRCGSVPHLVLIEVLLLRDRLTSRLALPLAVLGRALGSWVLRLGSVGERARRAVGERVDQLAEVPAGLERPDPVPEGRQGVDAVAEPSVQRGGTGPLGFHPGGLSPVHSVQILLGVAVGAEQQTDTDQNRESSLQALCNITLTLSQSEGLWF